MNRSILWNGFEIKKGVVDTSVGEVPYLYYTPEMSKEPVNIAIHGETYSKDEWLCFNSVMKSGNLLKESIRKNSPFLAFDLYGHGEWEIDDKNFNPSNMSKEKTSDFISISSKGISEAIKFLLKQETIEDNPVTIVANSLGCGVVLNMDLKIQNLKTVLISPFYSDIKLECNNFLVFRGKHDSYVKEDDFNKLYSLLPEKKKLISCDSDHNISEDWINKAKDFIYSHSKIR